MRTWTPLVFGICVTRQSALPDPLQAIPEESVDHPTQAPSTCRPRPSWPPAWSMATITTKGPFLIRVGSRDPLLIGTTIVLWFPRSELSAWCVEPIGSSSSAVQAIRSITSRTSRERAQGPLSMEASKRRYAAIFGD